MRVYHLVARCRCIASTSFPVLSFPGRACFCESLLDDSVEYDAERRAVREAKRGALLDARALGADHNLPPRCFRTRPSCRARSPRPPQLTRQPKKTAASRRSSSRRVSVRVLTSPRPHPHRSKRLGPRPHVAREGATDRLCAPAVARLVKASVRASRRRSPAVPPTRRPLVLTPARSHSSRPTSSCRRRCPSPWSRARPSSSPISPRCTFPSPLPVLLSLSPSPPPPSRAHPSFAC